MMHLNLQRSTTRLAAAVCGVLLVCLVGVGMILLRVDPDRVSRRTWRGYYTLLIDGDGDTAAVAAKLARSRGVQAIVSRYTSLVSFNTFGGFGFSTVAALPERLDPADPRLDPYLTRIRSLFTLNDGGRRWEVMYLRSALPRWRVVPTVAAAAGTRRWASPDLDRRGTPLRVLLLVASAALLVLRSRSRETAVVLAAGTLPWLAAVLVGTHASVLLFLLTTPLWAAGLSRIHEAVVLHAQEAAGQSGPARARRAAARRSSRLPRRRNAGGRPAGPAGLSGVLLRWRRVQRPVQHVLPLLALGLAALLLLRRDGATLLSMFLPAASGLLLVPLQAGVTLLASRWPMHPVFQAVPILTRLRRRRPWLDRRRFFNLLLVAVAAGSLGAAAVEVRTRGGPACYAPEAIAGAGTEASWASLERLAAAGSRAEPPTLADYLSHRAYQEGLPFGRGYGLPSPGERIAITHYLAGAGGPQLIRTRRVVKRFQDSWLEETLAEAAPGSVERLLLDQGFATRVVYTRAARTPWPVLAVIATLLFLLSWLFGPDFRLTPPHLCVTTSLTLRRSHHPS